MKGAMTIAAVAVATTLAGAGSVRAQDGLSFTLRGGAFMQPGYFGSDDLAYGPDFSISNLQLNYGGRELGGGPQDGLGLRGSFRYIGERTADDYSELAGLDDVDASLELGLGYGYVSRNFEAFADLRYGVIGHESLVASVGADAVFYPTGALTMRFGPRVLFGSEEYANTYFGVSAAESVASAGQFDAYEADGGPMTAGVELGMTYQINEDWGIDGAVAYEQFVGAAADSPIVEQGSEEQLSIRLGVTRNVSLGF
ncbi:MipA/OmpV family protein [Pelagovum pacificum]|nr:MipA/OmpV family protein [Pelagovum pacificum]QQA44089.1 MipA/OmpV family protein [Pelagovum pacificum]